MPADLTATSISSSSKGLINPSCRIILALTGASGMIYAQRLLTHLLASEIEVHLIVSRQAATVLKTELGCGPDYFQQLPVMHHDCQDFSSPLATGSFHTQGMIILPCSMNSLSAIAQGLSLNLVHRAAAVCLKERRKLILVPRETPLSSIHLKNMLTLSQEGAVILPASPAFYNHPKDLEELVEFFIQRILDQIGYASACFEAYARRVKEP
ncbi:MAG: UbiX family flavin prenyltransferase [bacterium]